MNALREELNTERQAREDTQKEKDTRTAKHLSIENELLVKYSLNTPAQHKASFLKNTFQIEDRNFSLYVRLNDAGACDIGFMTT